MLIEITPEELAVIQQALHAALDLGDTYYTFAPYMVCGGAKVYYGEGDIAKEEHRAGIARVILKRLDAITPERPFEFGAVIGNTRKRGISVHVMQSAFALG